MVWVVIDISLSYVMGLYGANCKASFFQDWSGDVIFWGLSNACVMCTCVIIGCFFSLSLSLSSLPLMQIQQHSA